jgi:probable phosphoglycerate mutase
LALSSASSFALTALEATERFPDLHQRYRQDPAHFEMQGKLPVAELWVEAQAAWQEILAQPGACVLVVAHNAINQALVATALGLGPAAYRRFIQSNGGITVLNFNDQGQVQLESLNQTAHLGLPLLSGSAPTRLLLVRHGETHWNREGRFQGQLDIPLNATGQAQSQKTVDLLKGLAIDKVFTSPLQRPRATAQALAEQKGLPLTVIPDLQEISHGTWEGKLQSEVEVEYPGLLAQWTQHPETVQMPEGENLQDIWLRTTRAWQAILQQAEGTTSLVVAHDAINKALLCQWVGLGAEAIWRFKQGNGAVTVLDYPEGITGPAVLRTVNYTAHLDGGIFDCTAAGAL